MFYIFFKNFSKINTNKKFQKILTNHVVLIVILHIIQKNYKHYKNNFLIDRKISRLNLRIHQIFSIKLFQFVRNLKKKFFKCLIYEQHKKI